MNVCLFALVSLVFRNDFLCGHLASSFLISLFLAGCFLLSKFPCAILLFVLDWQKEKKLRCLIRVKQPS